MLFGLGIDSKQRACNLVKLRVRDVSHRERIASWATVLQQETHRPVLKRVAQGRLTALAVRARQRREETTSIPGSRERQSARF